LLYLSLYFKQHRRLYYDLLDRVRCDGDWEAWLDFFLEESRTPRRRAVTTARRLVKLFEADNRRVAQAGRGAARALKVLAALRSRPVLSITHLRDCHGMTFPTASKAMDSLIELGIATELTGKARNRVFTYAAYLAALQEGSRLSTPLPGRANHRARTSADALRPESGHLPPPRSTRHGWDYADGTRRWAAGTTPARTRSTRPPASTMNLALPRVTPCEKAARG
jgi:hypothetical protein